MRFISVRARNSIVMHGHADDSTEITEEVNDEEFVEKLLSIERIQSISERYILVSSSHGRVLHGEYVGGRAGVPRLHGTPAIGHAGSRRLAARSARSQAVPPARPKRQGPRAGGPCGCWCR